jgi:hypothetical protein
MPNIIINRCTLTDKDWNIVRLLNALIITSANLLHAAIVVNEAFKSDQYKGYDAIFTSDSILIKRPSKDYYIQIASIK